MLVDQLLRNLAATAATDADAELLAKLLDIVCAGSNGLAYLGILDGLADAHIHDAANINASYSRLQ